MCGNDLFAVYDRLKGKYQVMLTTSREWDSAFTIDTPLIAGKSDDKVFGLYEDDLFVLCVMNEERTKATHFHPIDIEDAVMGIVDLLEGENRWENWKELFLG